MSLRERLKQWLFGSKGASGSRLKPRRERRQAAKDGARQEGASAWSAGEGHWNKPELDGPADMDGDGDE